jgi:hypothetical protein
MQGKRGKQGQQIRFLWTPPRIRFPWPQRHLPARVNEWFEVFGAKLMKEVCKGGGGEAMDDLVLRVFWEDELVRNPQSAWMVWWVGANGVLEYY